MRNLNNTVQLIGRLGKDLQLIHENGDSKIALGSIAVNNRYKNSKGQMVEKADWFTFKVYNNVANNAIKYTKKGQMVILEGKLTTEKFTTKDGEEKWSTIVAVQNVMYL